MPTHPLEPLTAAEVQQAVSYADRSELGRDTRIISIMQNEPGKDAVYA